MGFMKRWEAGTIVSQIRACSSEMNYAGNDGFSQWGCKKDLLEVKYLLDEILSNAPNFGDDEKEFISQLEQQKILNILKHEKKN
jgi:hypothetical protein